MAGPKEINGEKLLIQVGDGATPTEVFAHPCLINTERGIAFSSSTNDTVIPDCTDPSLPGWILRNKDGLSASITGGGVLDTASVEAYFDWFKGKATKNVRVKVDVLAANGGGYWAGAFHLTGFEITGDRLNTSTVSVTLMSSGVIAWTDAT